MNPRTQIFVVTPSFNAAGTIEQTIMSILTQVGNFDLVYHVQDGGSSDGTIDILRKWHGIVSDKLLPTFCRSIAFSFDSSEDNGLYDAIARGFRRFSISDDSWMTWINADDLLLPGSCALLAKIDENPRERHIKWVTGGSGVMKDDTVIAQSARPAASPVVREGICDGRHWEFVQQEGAFFRHIMWRNVKVDSEFRSLRYAGDWNLWRRFAQKYRLFQVDRPLGLFRVRQGQISQAFRPQYEAEMESLVPTGKRLLSLRSLADTNIERSVLTFAWPSGEVGFQGEPLRAHASRWLDRRLGARHDSDWQFPAVTEKRAAEAVWQSWPANDGTTIFAFPWATLIDQIANGVDSAALMSQLKSAAGRMRRTDRVVTVCQHVRMLAHRDLFDAAGVTDIFWSHATRGMKVWPGKRPIALRPFPLYPVQVSLQIAISEDERRPYLFGFAGAGANTWYLSEVRNWIIRDLAGDPRGVVIGRDGWHYDKVVYDHQIRRSETQIDRLVDQAASDEFKRLLRDSTFALCPSGSGPNSIRLWEAIGAGSIPVILADSYAPPGDMALWEEAAVFCPETEEAVRALPDQLAAMAADPALIARKRRALRQIWMLYGPDNFIHDIRRFAFTQASQGLAAAKPRPTAEAKPPRIRVGLIGRHSSRTPLSYPAYAPFFTSRVEVVKKLEDADVLVTGFDLDFRENIETVAQLLKKNPRLRLAVISEEPLWDTVWARGFRETTVTFSEKGHEVRYAAINHANSDVYDFDGLPYFVTTTDEYPARYNYLFTRNVLLTPETVLERWQKAPVRAAFYAEKRVDERYTKAYPDIGIHALSGYRSELAALFDGDGVVRVGLGWGDAPRRQSLPDWHLEKLAALDGNAFLVSAIENTHQRNYVTEKLFDAFAVGGVPLYWAAKDHAVHRIAAGGFLNLHGKTAKEAAEFIGRWTPDLDFATKWVAAQRELAARFSDPLMLARERDRVAQRVVSNLERLMLGDWPDLAAPVDTVMPDIAVTTSVQPPPAPSDTKTPPDLTGGAAAPDSASGDTRRGSHAGLAPVRFAAAKIVENVRLSQDYQHINIHLSGLAYGDTDIQATYFKIQNMGDARFGLEFVKSDTFAENTPDWTDEQGDPLDRLSVFFGDNDDLLWSVNPGPELMRLTHGIISALPDIFRACDFADAGVDPASWKAVLAVAERALARHIKAVEHDAAAVGVDIGA